MSTGMPLTLLAGADQLKYEVWYSTNEGLVCEGNGWPVDPPAHWDRFVGEADMLRLVAAVRREALEEAAKLCEDTFAAKYRAPEQGVSYGYHPDVADYAAAIRALIDQKPPEDYPSLQDSAEKFNEPPRDLLRRAILRGVARWIPDPDPLSRKANLAIGERAALDQKPPEA